MSSDQATCSVRQCTSESSNSQRQDQPSLVIPSYIVEVASWAAIYINISSFLIPAGAESRTNRSEVDELVNLASQSLRLQLFGLKPGQHRTRSGTITNQGETIEKLIPVFVCLFGTEKPPDLILQFLGSVEHHKLEFIAIGVQHRLNKAVLERGILNQLHPGLAHFLCGPIPPVNNSGG